MTVVERDPHVRPTEDRPGHGQLLVAGVFFAAALRWRDDEVTCVVQGVEFDVQGLGSSWTDAYEDFWVRSNELFEYLVDVSVDGVASAEDLRVAELLGPRIIDALEAWNRCLRAELDDRSRNFLAALKLRRPATAKRLETWLPVPATRENSERLLPA